MKALVCNSFGPINQLELKEIPRPTPSNTQVVIDVSYASVNFPDALIVQGLYQVKPPTPFTPGHELSGVISQVGKDVKAFKVGDRVVATPGIGGFAESVVVEEAKVLPLPKMMSMQQGASLTLTYGTSLHALKNCANLHAGETVLVLGAAGGVGIAAIEIAKAMGANVIAAASTAKKLDFCKKSGADYLINYELESIKDRVQEITSGKGVDIVYDAVGGKYSEPAIRALGWRGKFLVVGFAAGDIPKIPLNLTLLSERSIIGVFWGEWVRRNPEGHKANMELLSSWFSEKKVSPPVCANFPLIKAIDAIDHLASRSAVGKVVVEINANIQ